MTENEFDVVVVGARCAGATLATLLARGGARVLLLDKDAMPSEHVLSTHSVSPPGMDVLDDVGVGDAVRSKAPASRVLRLDLEGQPFDLKLSESRALYCPRRERLDGLLQKAAMDAGARMLDRARVLSLIQNDGRVCGVHARIGEQERTFTARLVVGADGRHSTIARLAGAEEYLGYDAPRATYWGYFDAASVWKNDPAYAFDAYFSLAGTDIRAIFQTERDQLLIANSPPVSEAHAWRADPEGTLLAALSSDPVIAPLVRDSRRHGKVRGTVRERFFFRRAAGLGWALVGDAGHHKEYLLGDGITEALLQARGLAKAVAASTDIAVARWWRARDVAALPLYFIGQIAAAPERMVELHRIFFSNIARQPALMARMVEVIDRRISPFDAVPTGQLLSWVTSAALHGRWRVIGEMVGMGRHAWTVDREIRLRNELLAETDAAA